MVALNGFRFVWVCFYSKERKKKKNELNYGPSRLFERSLHWRQIKKNRPDSSGPNMREIKMKTMSEWL